MAKKLNITPLHDRVIVKAAAAEEKTAGGIIIPDTAKEKPQRGTVIAAGPGKKDEPVTVKAGDTVLYGKYAGTEITVEGKRYTGNSIAPNSLTGCKASSFKCSNPLKGNKASSLNLLIHLKNKTCNAPQVQVPL